MKIEIFSDVACPFCFIGKRHLDRALEQFDAAPVEVIWRSYQLNPDLPDGLNQDMHGYLAEKYGVAREEAISMNSRMLDMATAAGIEMNLSKARPRNTFHAHRMLQLALEAGLGDAVSEALFSAYFTGSADVGDPAALVELAVAAGLDAGEAEAVAHGDRYTDRVLADITEARSIGISAVPAFIIDRSLLVSGAQPPELLCQALEQAAAGTPA